MKQQKRQVNSFLFPNQLTAFKHLISNQYDLGLYGGAAGGGKSYWIAESAWILVNMFPGSRGFLAREELKKLKKTTLLEFFRILSREGLRRDIDYRYNEQDSYIEFFDNTDPTKRTVVDLIQMDYRPSDPDYNYLGSTQYTWGFIDEVQEIKWAAVETMTVRMRYLTEYFGFNGCIGMTCNPSNGWLKKKFYTPWLRNRLKKNRFFVPSKVEDNIFIDPRYKTKLSKISDPVIRARLKDGSWNFSSDPNQLIPFEWMEDIFVDNIPDEGRKRIALDVAREGKDKTVACLWKGNVLIDLRVIEVDISDKSNISGNIARELIRYAKANGIGYNNIIVDETGLGGGVVDAARGLGWFVQGFKGASGVTRSRKELRRNKKLIFIGEDEDKVTNFDNLRIYSYWKFRIGLQTQQIKIYSGVRYFDSLEEELTGQRYISSEDSNSIKLEKKDKLHKRIGRSPDFADSVTMGYYCPEKKQVNLSFA